jgi:hypothetical protein
VQVPAGARKGSGLAQHAGPRESSSSDFSQLYSVLTTSFVGSRRSPGDQQN